MRSFWGKGNDSKGMFADLRVVHVNAICHVGSHENPESGMSCGLKPRLRASTCCLAGGHDATGIMLGTPHEEGTAVSKNAHISIGTPIEIREGSARRTMCGSFPMLQK